jgi:hypothetical protein
LAQELEVEGQDVHEASGAALVAAAAKGHESIARLLLDAPQHAPRADCEGGAALHQAVLNGRHEVAELLLARLVPSGNAAAVAALRRAAAVQGSEELERALAALAVHGDEVFEQALDDAVAGAGAGAG